MKELRGIESFAVSDDGSYVELTIVFADDERLVMSVGIKELGTMLTNISMMQQKCFETLSGNPSAENILPLPAHTATLRANIAEKYLILELETTGQFKYVIPLVPRLAESLNAGLTDFLRRIEMGEAVLGSQH